MYTLFKYLHILTVNITISLFVVRGYWMIINSPQLTRRWVRVTPHINDTLLLTAALTMTYLSGWHLFTQSWLIAKLLALLVYIILGSIAIRPGRPKLVRIIAWLCALVVFGYIVLVAITKDPWPF
ncbi:SirB2 family protein [Gammaproteobacteria bacterium]